MTLSTGMYFSLKMTYLCYTGLIVRYYAKYMEFVNFRCDSVARLQGKLEYLRSLLNDTVIFKSIYRYAFDFAKVSI